MTWVLRANPFGANGINDVATDGAGVWMAVGEGPSVATSADNGATWTDLTANIAAIFAGAVADIQSIAFGAGTWVAGGFAQGAGFGAGGSPFVIRTTDGGATWTLVYSTPNNPATLVFMAFGAGTFVGVDSVATSIHGHNYWTSTDGGVTWIAQNTFNNGGFAGIIFDGTDFVAACADTNPADPPGVAYSADGVHWTLNLVTSFPNTGSTGGPINYGLAYNGSNLYINLDDSPAPFMETSPARAWAGTAVPNSVSPGVFALAYGNGLFVAGTDTGPAYSSDNNGISWTQEDTLFAGSSVIALKFGNGVFVAVGSNGHISTRVAPIAPSCDPDFADVSLLLHFDGVNGGTVFTDSSSFNHPVTASPGPTPTTDTSTFAYGTASGNFPGGFGSYAYVPITADLDFGLGDPDFTIEGWFKLANPAAQQTLFCFGQTTLGPACGIRVYTNADILTLQGLDPNCGGIDISAQFIAANSWNSFAVVRQGAHMHLYLNGVRAPGSGLTITGPLNTWTTAVNGIFGNGFNVGLQIPYTGFLDEMRFTKGLARYTGATYTPQGPFGGICITEVTVPNVLGLTVADATTAITAALLGVGTITAQPSITVPAGSIIAQDPISGTTVAPGTLVNLIRSTGGIIVPDIVTDTASQANAAILALGLSVGQASTGFSDTIAYGNVISQSPAPGTLVLPGSPVNYAISVPASNFNFNKTVISQYANSPSVLRLVENMDEYINPGTNLATFYQYVWNVDTAVGFGLDIWGKIVGVSRLLQIPGSDPIVGFDNTDTPKDWQPMSQGRFALENEATTAFLLPDDAYRVLILTKALANIVSTTAPALNQLLRNMFPGRGRCFVRDLGNMAMQFVFNFSLTPVELAILTQSGALPHPAGVLFSVIVVPAGLFGFQGQGDTVRPFNFGVFNKRP